MQVLQLIQDTEGWMYRQGFSRATITLGYRPHWNKFRRLVGEETDFSKCNLSQSVKSIYGKDIFSTDPYRLSKTESNARKAFYALREFNSSGRVSRRPRSGVSIEKPLTAESSRILNGYEGHLLGRGLTEAPPETTCRSSAAFWRSARPKTLPGKTSWGMSTGSANTAG